MSERTTTPKKLPAPVGAPGLPVWAGTVMSEWDRRLQSTKGTQTYREMALFDVPPSLAIDDVGQMRLANPELSRQFDAVAGSVPSTDRPNVSFCKPRVALSFASRSGVGVNASPMPGPRRRPALTGHIGHVVIIGSEKQVVGIDAVAVLASGAVVTDDHAIRDATTEQRPRNAVGSHRRGRWRVARHFYCQFYDA